MNTGIKPTRSEAPAEFAGYVAQHYSADLHRFLVHRTHRQQDVEDLVQEVYVRLLRIEKSDFIRNPRAYILTTAARVAHDFLSKDRRALEHVVVDSQIADNACEVASNGAADTLAASLSTQKQLNAAVAKLPPIYQVVLLMFAREGYSYSEIAQQLKISVHQVERYLASAKQALIGLDWNPD